MSTKGIIGAMLLLLLLFTLLGTWPGLYSLGWLPVLDNI